MKLLHTLARVSAVLAGVVLTLITLMTCASLIGRNTVGVSLVGDFELTGVAAGAAIALFMPWCQVRRGHIIVDFFTTRLAPATNAQLDRLGALAVAVAMFLLAWRTTLGGLNSYNSQSTTMMLGFPEWIAYAGIAPPLALSGLIALAQALRLMDGSGPDDASDTRDASDSGEVRA